MTIQEFIELNMASHYPVNVYRATESGPLLVYAGDSLRWTNDKRILESAVSSFNIINTVRGLQWFIWIK